MIAIENISYSYGKVHALRNVGFTVPSGHVAGLIGPNGAGKSTLLKILSGYLTPQEGEVYIDGLSLFRDPIEARRRLSYVQETPLLYREMRVLEYLKFVWALKEGRSVVRSELDIILEKTGLSHLCKMIIGNLSKGNRQRVALAQALIGNPSVMLLDEPTSALDPAQIIEIRNFVRGVAGRVTVILSSHILSEVSQTCNYLILIRKGEVEFNGPIATLPEQTHGVAKKYRFFFAELSDNIITLMGMIPGAIVSSYQHVDNTIVTEVSNEDVFFQSLFNHVAEQKIPLREIRRDESSLESLFKRS